MSQPDPSHSNRNLLATIYDSLARGNVDTLMASLTDDIEWRVHRPSPVAGICNSKQEVLAFFPKMMAPYEGTLRVEVTAIVADDHDGFVAVKESAQRPSPRLAYTGVHVWGFGEGRIFRFESYYDDTYTEFWSARTASQADPRA